MKSIQFQGIDGLIGALFYALYARIDPKPRFARNVINICQRKSHHDVCETKLR